MKQAHLQTVPTILLSQGEKFTKSTPANIYLDTTAGCQVVRNSPLTNDEITQCLVSQTDY